MNHRLARVYLKTPNAPGQRTFSRCAAPFFLEIRQYSCEKMSCSAQKFLAAGHIGSFQIHPRSESPLDSLKSKKELREKVNEFFNSLLPEKGNRLIIMVDELDRCKPSYAVKLLERIKHYFTNDRITFVFSVNTYELEKTIRKYYGDDFDAGRYLSRFFDLHISIPPVNMRKCAYRLYAVERKIDTKVRNIGQQKCYNDLRKRRRSLAWHTQRASRLKNFVLVSAPKTPAGRNYSGFGFQTASSVRNAAVRNITRFAGGTRSSVTLVDARPPSPQEPLCTARICR